MIGIPELRKLLSYNPETGVLTWNERPSSDFSDRRIWKMWNTKYSGKQALTHVNNNGYFRGRVSGQYMMAHVACYALYHGVFPTLHIDHINGDRGDNRALNLRAVTQSENMRNTKISVRNTSGVMGVRFVANRWRARINVDGREINLGRYKKKEDAISAREEALELYCFHENHGRRA
jgi:hypothetical protein